MSEQPDTPPPDAAIEAEPRRIAFERLRERTDELELIISGLLAFALIAMPGWLFDQWADASVHAAGIGQIMLTAGFIFASGFCYTLAFAFLAHLAVRGYWVGLIGLKSTFSRGIQWDSLKALGPISRQYFESRMPDLMTVIDRADRAGSILFAMAILFALMLAWASALLVMVVGLGGLIGALFGMAEDAVLISFGVIYGALILVNVALMVMDVWLARRRPELASSPRYVRWVHRLIRLAGLMVPQRLILPVQLSLQSNLSAKLFITALFLVMSVAPMIGVVHVAGSREFSLIGGYGMLDTAAVDTGMASAHYENLRDENDRLLRWPIVASDRVDQAYLRLFLPNLPNRDNGVLAERCPDMPGEATARVACVAGLWTITLDGEPVDVAGFLPTERRDLGMRGLQGYLVMTGLAPGRHDLLVVWNAEGAKTGASRRREYRIPFWLSPGFEQATAEAPALP